MKGSRTHSGFRGFTLIELLVVVAVMALLIAILLPSLARAKERARATYCLANMHHIGAALYFYTYDNDGFVPPRMIGAGNSTGGGPPGYQLQTSGNTVTAFWSDQILLGQYASSTNGNNMNPSYEFGSVSKRSPFICPSDLTHPPTGGNLGSVSYGMPPNFTSVTSDLGTAPPTMDYSKMWKLSNAVAPMTEMVCVDSLSPRMSPGGWSDPYAYYGNTEPLVNGNWLDSDPNSNYNWARRHFGGANVLFLDGHATAVAELKTAYSHGELTVHRVE